jgi:hypothetical protein
MSAPKYKYGHGIVKRRPRKALLVIGCSILLVGIIVGFIFLDLRKNTNSAVEGQTRVVGQALGENTQQMIVDEPLYSFELPSDWKETKRNENQQYTSISWQATTKSKENRFLTLYIDKIPFDMPYNRIVTVKAQGNGISFSNVSDNCANFTVGGTQDGHLTQTSKPTVTKWNKVDFICNLPQAVDNQVGTGSEASPNSVTVTGASKGSHKYFFHYTDRNFQPDYTILYNALSTFRAK